MDTIAQLLVEWGYIGLFIASFAAGSILPFSSEVVLTILVQMGSNPWLCLIAATIGNTLGGLVCYWLGWLGNPEWIERWLKVDKAKLDKVLGFVKRYGAWMGLFGMLPWVGEAIIVALGFLRSNLTLTTVTMFIGKALRYLAIILALQGVNAIF